MNVTKLHTMKMFYDNVYKLTNHSFKELKTFGEQQLKIEKNLKHCTWWCTPIILALRS